MSEDGKTHGVAGLFSHTESYTCSSCTGFDTNIRLAIGHGPLGMRWEWEGSLDVSTCMGTIVEPTHSTATCLHLRMY